VVNNYEHPIYYFQIFDISDPTNPFPLGNCSGYGWITGIYVSGSYALLSGNTLDMMWNAHGILWVADISDPNHPVLASNYGPLATTDDIAGRGNNVFVAANGTLAFDISDPIHPQLIDSIGIPAIDIEIDDNMAYLALSANGFKVIDISNPHNMMLVESYNTPGYAKRISARNGLIYLADGFSFSIFRNNAVGIENDEILPKKAAIIGCYPNPFNASAIIRYSLPQAGPVRLSIYNVAGQSITTLCDEYQNAGEHSIIWNGAAFASGTYFARLECGNAIQSVKMVLLK